MEKEEAVSLREAMEDMVIKRQEEEARVYEAAQNEASELVHQHQNPEPAINPDAPYRYNDHLRKNSYQHARTQSVGRYSGAGIVTGLARDIVPRSVSGSSNSSAGADTQRSRHSYDLSDQNSHPEAMGRSSLDSSLDMTKSRPNRKSYGSMSSIPGTSRRRSNGKRNVSGELAGMFTGEQIWEEPEQEELDRGRPQETQDMPAPLRLKLRNPLNRVQFAPDLAPRSNSTPPELIKRLSTSEIHRNPPSQSRNPNYTANPPPVTMASEIKKPEEEATTPPVPMKDGLEIRSDEIRQATSMRLKDRSPKLPTPTVVSDRPGRPIVSFDANWKPKEADVKPELRRRSPFDRRPNSTQGQSVPARSDPKDVQTPLPTIHLPDSTPNKVNPAIVRPLPTINQSPARSLPTISHPQSAPVIPTIHLPDSDPIIPTVNLPDQPPIPTVNLPDGPSISVSSPPTPSISINVGLENVKMPSKGARPLPTPQKRSSTFPTQTAQNRMRAGIQSIAGNRATVRCSQCQLPIEGKVVKFHKGQEHFHPECLVCFVCHTPMESLEIFDEPEVKHKDRVDRIRRRARGEQLPEVEGQTQAEDGNEQLRLYCHLDYHENFAPRCKHCKSTIIGEHLVALGETWHHGHFFCAECGDPFEKGMSHIEKDGYAWCTACQTKRTANRAPKCKKCNQPVIGQYAVAMGGEWHEKCFRCITCDGGLTESFFEKEVGGETLPQCKKCCEIEVKKKAHARR